jgi:hypothetical protein
VAGQQFEYGFDDTWPVREPRSMVRMFPTPPRGTRLVTRTKAFSHGLNNRESTKAGGNDSGSGLRSASYTVNSVNQYTQRTVSGTNGGMGSAIATNSVTVNSVTAYRKYYRVAVR